MRNEGKLVSQRQLLQEVWGPAYETETNYLRVYLAQLRRKLEADPSTSASSDHRAGNGLPVMETGRIVWKGDADSQARALCREENARPCVGVSI